MGIPVSDYRVSFGRTAVGEDSDGPTFAEMTAPFELAATGGPSFQKKTKKQLTKQNTVKIRKEFPETWLWTEDMVK